MTDSTRLHACLRRWGACCFALAAFGPVRGQEAGVPVFRESVEVRVVEVEVAVRDPQGRHVAGLRPDDFRLTVDGRVEPIDFFSEQRGGAVAGAAPRDREPRSEAREAASTASARLNLLVYIDEELSLPIDLERVLIGLESQIDHLSPRDRVAIVAWNGRRLERILDWSPAGPELRSALSEARRRPAWGLRSRLDTGGWRAPFTAWSGNSTDLLPDESRRGVTGGGVCAGDEGESTSGCLAPATWRENAVSRRSVFEIRNRLERAARAAAAAVRSFDRPPGRRALILLAGGWPEPLVALPGRGQPSYAWSDAAALRWLDPLLDVADQLGYTIYPVDVPGMLSVFGADVERRGPGVRSSGFSASPEASNASEARFHRPLRHLAERTGGVAFLDGRRREALAGIASDARSYYSIAFTAPRERDDSAHRIGIEVARPGVTVRARRRFRDLSDSTDLGYQVEAALLDGSRDLAGTPLLASAGPPVRDGLVRIRVPLQIEVPRRELVEAGAGEADRGIPAELRIAAVDSDGRRTLIGPVRIVLASPASDPGIFTTEVPIRLRRADQELAVSLYVQRSGRHFVTVLRIAP